MRIELTKEEIIKLVKEKYNIKDNLVIVKGMEDNVIAIETSLSTERDKF